MLKSNVTKKISVISASLGLLTLFTALILTFSCCASAPPKNKPSGYPLIRANSVVPSIEADANQPNNSDSDFDDVFDLNKSVCINLNSRLPKTETTNEATSTCPNKQDSDSDEVLELKVNISFDPNTSLPIIDPIDEDNAVEDAEPISTNKNADTNK